MNTSIRVLLLVLFLPLVSHALTLDALRSRVNSYLKDKSNFILPADTKDSIINSAMVTYAGMFPVKVDTFTVSLDSAERMDTLPSNFSGIVLTAHKFDRKFTQIFYVPGDSIPDTDSDVPQWFTMRERWIVFYPPPITVDSVFVFYAVQPPSMDSGAAECPLLDFLEEPLILLACHNVLYAADLRLDLQANYWEKFVTKASRLTRTKIERAMP